MAIDKNNANYVKFTRGTPKAYENLQNKDADTLYFISEPNDTTGVLYLGNKVIAGGSSGVSITSLKDLTDVLIQEDIQDGSLLMYDDESEKWIVKTLAQVFELMVPIMIGATSESDGQAGLVPVPLINQQDFVLLGNGTWSDSLKNLTSVVNTLVAEDNGLSAREIAEVVFNTQVGDIGELKEIVDWFKEHPDFTNYNQRLIHLEGTIFDQGVEGQEGFIPGLQTVVGTLNIQMQEVVQEINDIYERLTWQEMDEDVSEYLFDDNNENITMATTTVGTF